MKKAIVIFGLVALLVMSSFAAAGFWEDLTGRSIFSKFFGQKTELAKTEAKLPKAPADAANVEAVAPTLSRSPVQMVSVKCGERLGQFATSFVCGDNRSVYAINASGIPPADTRLLVKVLARGRIGGPQWIAEGESAVLNGVRVTVVDAWRSYPAREPTPDCGAVLALKCMELTAAPAERMAYWSGMFGSS